MGEVLVGEHRVVEDSVFDDDDDPRFAVTYDDDDDEDVAFVCDDDDDVSSATKDVS